MAILAVYANALTLRDESAEAAATDEVATTTAAAASESTEAATGAEAPVVEAPEPYVVPDNYRAPPKQDQTSRGPRERPNIFDHPLLKSMDLTFVGDKQFASPDQQQQYGGPQQQQYGGQQQYGQQQ